MKVGDLVKRTDTFKEWLKDNAYMTLEEEQEMGIIIEVCFPEPRGHPAKRDIVVKWGHTGISYEDEAELEVVQYKQ